MSEVRGAFGWTTYLLPFIPLAIVLEVIHAGPVAVFAASAVGVIPTASLMGKATEELAARSGPGIGGFLNVTFGNAPELIIALVALNAGLHEVVKASVVGSILGNVLLVLGVARPCSSAAWVGTAAEARGGWVSLLDACLRPMSGNAGLTRHALLDAHETLVAPRGGSLFGLGAICLR
jgi:hypothetical protein